LNNKGLIDIRRTIKAYRAPKICKASMELKAIESDIQYGKGKVITIYSPPSERTAAQIRLKLRDFSFGKWEDLYCPTV
jgi:hypothetical protein